ncbi:hypothetical protein H2200_000061 [Cladophialophora chaetospira]|uniref:Uncharacterized protein n=1 Tax=Cladophialophora chaetospira TaxID=386627 RepID=A0AA39CQK6_9EURO|nr:hypothetical protein H2200_000061 [Cladophialophora chaetospira]
MPSKSVPPHFVFVQGQSHGRSGKDSEVQLAKARSHAARVAHRRKNPEARAVPGLAQILSKDHRPRVIRFRLLTQRSEEEEQHNKVPLSDYSPSTGLRVDPFFCLGSADDKGVASAIDFFCSQALCPRFDVLFKVLNMIPVNDFVMESMAADPAFYHVSIAVTRMMLDNLSGLKPSGMVLHHRGLALSNLRKSLAQDDAGVYPTAMCTMVSWLCLRSVPSNHIVLGWMTDYNPIRNPSVIRQDLTCTGTISLQYYPLSAAQELYKPTGEPGP